MDNDKQSKNSNNTVYRSQEYIRVTRNVRWVVIALVLTSFAILPGQEILEIAVLSSLAILYNLMMYVPKIEKVKWLSAKPSVLIIDTLFIFTLLSLCDAKLMSPYVALLVFPIISSAFWYGYKVVAGIGLVQIILGIAILIPQIEPDFRINSAKSFIVNILAFVSVGIYIAYLTRSDRQERLNIAEVDFQVNQERQQLLALINNIADAVLVIDGLGKIGLFNDATAKLVGSQYALVGKSLDEVFDIVDESDNKVEIDSLAKSESSKRRDLKINLEDTSIIKVEIDTSPYIVNQEMRGLIVIIRDISKERTVEEQQEEFISVASHELRTPLAIAEANISTVLASPSAPADPNIRNMLNQAHTNIMFLSNIINDLTTLSKAENEKLEIDATPLDPGELIYELQGEFINQAHAKSLELKVNVAEDLESFITSRYRVKQIIQNFVINSLKYTESGTITISVQNAPGKEKGLLFEVGDTGVGISVSDQEKLFTKFFRSEDYRTQQTGGTGLGLYISAKVAKRLGGKVWCESKLKEGSKFYLQLPPYKAK